MAKQENVFEYEFMNTSLRIVLPNASEHTARTVAYECEHTVLEIENALSMFKYGGDISMLNNAEAGEILKIGEYAQECLLAAFKACEMSKGAVDVCMGEFFLKAKNVREIATPDTPRRGKFAFDTENYLVQKLEGGKIDLGSIGKGYALDKLDDVFTQWDIRDAFVSFGASSILALGKNADGEDWPINLGDKSTDTISNVFAGASGKSVLGEHIIDCRTGKLPKNPKFRTWAFSGSGAISDAMATAFMILDIPDIAEICSQYDIAAAVQMTEDSDIEFFG